MPSINRIKPHMHNVSKMAAQRNRVADMLQHSPAHGHARGSYPTPHAEKYKLKLPEHVGEVPHISASSASQSHIAPDTHINPAYVVGGVAAAGLGAAAAAEHLQNKPQEEHGVFDKAISGTLQVTDKVAGVAGSVAGYTQMAMLPVMLGSLGLAVGAPMASGVSKLTGWQAPVKGAAKAARWMEATQHYTVGQTAAKLNHITGHNTSGAMGKAFTKTAEISAPVTNTMAKIPGLGGLHSEHLKNIPQNIRDKSMLQTGMDTAFITTSAVSLYGVARDFSGQLLALRQLEADLTGKDVKEISVAHILAGSISKPASEARKKLLSISGVHAIAEMASMGLILKQAALNKLGFITGMLAWQVPDMVKQGAEGMLGESILPIYKGLSDAQRAGQQLPPEAYAQFLIAADESLRNRGEVGMMFAMEIAQEFVAENTSVAKVMEEASNGGIKQRVAALIERNKQQNAANAMTAQQPKSFVEKVTAPQAAPPRIPKERPDAVGAFTQKFQQQEALAAMNPTTQTVH